MKFCPNCRSQLSDETTFCPMCGVQLPVGAPQQPPVYQPQYAPYDHTAEFDPRDISDNKVYAMLLYLLGIPGIIIALLAANSSKYVAFHLRQALKFVVTETLLTLASLIMAGLGVGLAGPLAGIFVGYDPQLLAITRRAMTIYSLSFLFSGFNIYGSAFFTALNNGPVSAAISFLRTLVFQSAAILLFPETAAVSTRRSRLRSPS